jgi:hypothetical protein
MRDTGNRSWTRLKDKRLSLVMGSLRESNCLGNLPAPATGKPLVQGILGIAYRVKGKGYKFRASPTMPPLAKHFRRNIQGKSQLLRCVKNL